VGTIYRGCDLFRKRTEFHIFITQRDIPVSSLETIVQGAVVSSAARPYRQEAKTVKEAA
jgi:hypothetical protein